MTEDQAIAELVVLQKNLDPEVEHRRADEVLCKFLRHLGYEAIVDEYEKVTPKWYA